MKKGVILVLILLFSLELVNAQEIKVLGKSYPIILVAPIGFIGIILLFFLGLIIKDNIKKIKIPKIHLKKQEKTEIKVDYYNKFNLVKHKLGKISNEDELNEFNDVVKGIFKDKLNIKNEFSFAELGNIVKDHFREVSLANKIANLKYSGNNITNEQIKNLFKDFEILLKQYKLKHEVVKENLFEKIKIKFLNIFKKKEIKPILIKNVKEIKTPIKDTIAKKNFIYNLFSFFRKSNKIKTKEAKQIVKPKLINQEFKKPSFNLFSLFKRNIPEAKLKAIEEKNIRQEIIEKPINLELKPIKKYKFILFKNIKIKLLKFKILRLINKGRKIFDKSPLSAKRYYARALLSYYKLPINEENEIINKLMQFHNEMLAKRKNEKIFLDVSRNLINIKRKGKQVSKEGISLLNTLRNFMRREELFASIKLKEFSHKLNNEKRKLNHFLVKEKSQFLEGEHKLKNFINKEEKKLSNFIYDKSKLVINKLKEKVSILRDKINDLSKQNLNRRGLLDESIEMNKSISKQIISQKTINLVDNKKLYVINPESKAENIKKESRQLKILQKERAELYNKLIQLNDGKITHDKLN